MHDRARDSADERSNEEGRLFRHLRKDDRKDERHHCGSLYRIASAGCRGEHEKGTDLGEMKPVEVTSSQNLVCGRDREFTVSVSLDEVFDDSTRFSEGDSLSGILDRYDRALRSNSVVSER